MRKSLFTEAQIVGILKQAEAGRMVIDLCREHGITQATSYRWRSMYERVGECEGRVSIVPRGAAAPATQAAPQGYPRASWPAAAVQRSQAALVARFREGQLRERAETSDPLNRA